MYHSQHRPKSNRISQLFRCDFPAMRLHGGFDDGQANSDSLHRARVRFIHGTFTPRGSHAALPIACDAFNARTMAIREYHCPACTSSPTSCHTCFTAQFDRSAFSYGKASWRTCRTARHRQNVSVCPMMRRYIRAYFSKNCDATDLLLAGKG